MSATLKLNYNSTWININTCSSINIKTSDMSDGESGISINTNHTPNVYSGDNILVSGSITETWNNINTTNIKILINSIWTSIV